MGFVTNKGEEITSPTINTVGSYNVNPASVLQPDLYLPTEAELAQQKQTLLDNQEEERIKLVSEFEDKYETSVWKEAFKQENTLGSWLSNQTTEVYEPEEGYSPFTQEETLKGYEQYANSFVGLRSPLAVEDMKQQIDAEVERKQYLANVDNGTIASIAAGVFDPITVASMLIPMGGIARSASLAKNIGAGAVAGVVGEAITETALHSSQETRTMKESAINLGIGAIAGGAINGIGSVWLKRLDAKRAEESATLLTDNLEAINSGKSSSIFDGAVEEVKQESLLSGLGRIEVQADSLDIVEDLGEEGVNRSVGAAGVDFSGSELVGQGKGITGALIALQKQVSPNVYLAANTNHEIREIGSLLYSDNLIRKANLDGDKAFTHDFSVETVTKMKEDAEISTLTEHMNRDYTKYARNNPEVTKQEFESMVMDNFYEVSGASTDPIITDAADGMRSLMKMYSADMINQGMLNPVGLVRDIHSMGGDITGSDVKHVFKPMLWDYTTILNQRGTFENLLVKHIENLNIRLGKDNLLYGQKAKTLSKRQVADVARRMTGAILDDTKSTAAPYKELTDLFENSKEFTQHDLANMSGYIKTLRLDGNDFKQFQNRDYRQVINGYIHHYAPRIQLQRAANEYSTVLGENYHEVFVNQVDDIYGRKLSKLDKQIEGANGKKRKELEKERNSINKEYSATKDKVKTAIQVLDRTFEPPKTEFAKTASEAGRVLRVGTQVAYLGNVVASSITDLVTPMLQEGMTNYFGSLLHVAKGNMTKAGRAYRKLSREEQKANAIGLERLTQRRMKELAEMDLRSSHTTIPYLTKSADKLQEVFGKFSGMNYWTDAMKIMSGNATSYRLVRTAQKAQQGKLTKTDKVFMSQMGFDEQDMIDMVKYQRMFGDFTVDGSTGEMFFQAAKWSNRNAINMRRGLVDEVELDTEHLTNLAERIRASVLNRVDSTIVSPSKSDLPKMMHKEWGKLILQFKSWMLSYTGRTLIPAIQQTNGSLAAKANFVGSFTALGSLAVMADYFKHEMKGTDKKYDWNIGSIVQVAVNNSGILGILGEVTNITEQLSNNAIPSIASGIGMTTAALSGQSEEFKPSYKFGGAAGVFSIPAIGYGTKATTGIGGIAKGLSELPFDQQEGYDSLARGTKQLSSILPLQNAHAIGRILAEVENAYLNN